MVGHQGQGRTGLCSGCLSAQNLKTIIRQTESQLTFYYHGAPAILNSGRQQACLLRGVPVTCGRPLTCLSLSFLTCKMGLTLPSPSQYHRDKCESVWGDAVAAGVATAIHFPPSLSSLPPSLCPSPLFGTSLPSLLGGHPSSCSAPASSHTTAVLSSPTNRSGAVPSPCFPGGAVVTSQA